MADQTSARGAQVLTPAVGVAVPPSFPTSLPLPATGREVAHFVALRAAACVGADYSNLAPLTGDGNSLRLFHSPFFDVDLAARYTDISLDGPYPIAVAARDSRVVFLADLDSYREKFPGLVADTIAAGYRRRPRFRYTASTEPSSGRSGSPGQSRRPSTTNSKPLSVLSRTSAWNSRASRALRR